MCTPGTSVGLKTGCLDPGHVKVQPMSALYKSSDYFGGRDIVMLGQACEQLLIWTLNAFAKVVSTFTS